MLTLEKQVVYELKRRHGKPLQVYHATRSVNPATGLATLSTTYTNIKKAIVDKQSINSISKYLQSPEKYKEGGFFKINDLIVLIDKVDFNSTLTVEHNIIYNFLEYEIKQVFEQDFFWLVQLRRSQNQNSILHFSRGNALNITQNVSVTL